MKGSSITGWQRLVFQVRSQHWFHWLHHLYVVLALAAYISTVVLDVVDKAPILTSIFAVYLGIVFVVFLLISVSLGRKAKYAEASFYVHEALHCLRDLDVLLERNSLDPNENLPGIVKKRLEHCLTSTCSAFTLITGVACRMSIKVIGSTNDGPREAAPLDALFAWTLARDSVSAPSYRNADKNEGTTHMIHNNDDYRRLTTTDANFFVSHDLVADSPQTTYPEDSWNDSNGLIRSAIRNRSTLVWPIRYVYSEEERPVGQSVSEYYRTQSLYGFLTLDTDSRKVFELRYDERLGAAFADALYGTLSRYETALSLATEEAEGAEA